MSGGLATAAAERSMLRTPASRYADTLMEMDEDEVLQKLVNKGKSRSAELILKLKLTRKDLKKLFQMLDGDRKAQVLAARVITCTIHNDIDDLLANVS